MRGLGGYTLGDRYTTPDRRLSQMLMRQGSRGGPSDSWQETLGRIAQQLSGAYIGKLDQDKQDLANQTLAKVQPDEHTMQPTMNDQQIMESEGVQNILRQKTDADRMGNPMIQRNITAIRNEQDRIADQEQSLSDLQDTASRNRFTDGGELMQVQGPLTDKYYSGQIDRATQNIENYGDEFNQTMGRLRSQEPTDDQRAEAVRREILRQRRASEVNTLNEKMPQIDYALQNLRGLENNPYAQRLAQGLMMNKMSNEAASRLDAIARERQLADIQSGRDYTSGENQLNRQARIDAVSAKPPVPGRDTPYSQDVADQLANIAGAKEKAKKPTSDEIRNTAKIKEEVKQEAKVTGMRPKAKASLDSYSSKMDFVTGTIDSALDNVSNWSAQYGSLLSALPGSDANTLKNELQTIKANIGFQALQEMRANSPTGGALGNVANQELEALQATIGSLDQSQDTDVLRKNLTTLKAQLKSSAMRMKDAYAQTYGGDEGKNRRSTDGLSSAEQKELEQLKRDLGRQ